VDREEKNYSHLPYDLVDHLLMRMFEEHLKLRTILYIIINMFSNNLQIYRYNHHKEANNRAKQRHMTKMPINDEYFDKIEEN
jgi:hypothetical protein